MTREGLKAMASSDASRSRRAAAVAIWTMSLALAAFAIGCGSEETEAPEGASSKSAEDIRIGYLSGGNADPFVFTVTQSVREAANGAGVELFECDANFEDAKALNCARTMSSQGLDAVINWQFTRDAGPAVCTAYGELPTVAMDTEQNPCQKTLVGADNQGAGLIAGEALGKFAESKFGCEFDLYVSIENLASPDVNEARAGGAREGLAKVCGEIPKDKDRVINKTQGGGDRLANVRRQMTDILTSAPDARTILVMGSFGDPDAEAALAAAKTANREKDVFIVGQGADESACSFIRESPQWVGSVGYFPETYGSLAVRAAIALANGEQVTETNYVEHQLIDKNNIDEFYPACF